jgi:hypothetical protein
MANINNVAEVLFKNRSKRCNCTVGRSSPLVGVDGQLSSPTVHACQSERKRRNRKDKSSNRKDKSSNRKDAHAAAAPDGCFCASRSIFSTRCFGACAGAAGIGGREGGGEQP